MLNKQRLVVLVSTFVVVSCLKQPSHQALPSVATRLPPQISREITSKPYPLITPPKAIIIEKEPPKIIPAPVVIVKRTLPLSETTVVRAKPKPMSSAVNALLSIADKNMRKGHLEAAVVSLERGLRIEPRNALITYKLAQLRLQQLKPRLAEALARKSALLAAGDRALKKQSWLLIVKARRLQQNYEGAKEAQSKVQSFN